MDTYLADIKAKNAAGASPPIMGAFVVYDLPNRDCAALASNGEYQVADDGLNKYKKYVDSIAAIIKKYPETSIALVIGKSSSLKYSTLTLTFPQNPTVSATSSPTSTSPGARKLSPPTSKASSTQSRPSTSPTSPRTPTPDTPAG